MNIEISHMQLHSHRDRRSPVAFFSATLGGLRLNHCAIIRHQDGKIRATPPLMQNVIPGIHGVWFEDPALYAQFQQKAAAAYEAMLADEPEDAGLRRVLGADMEDALRQVAA